MLQKNVTGFLREEGGGEGGRGERGGEEGEGGGGTRPMHTEWATKALVLKSSSLM